MNYSRRLVVIYFYTNLNIYFLSHHQHMYMIYSYFLNVLFDDFESFTLNL